jgi:hypothetical protein
MSADPDLASDRIDVWVSKHTFDYLLGMLKAPGDPAVIGVSGIISSDGTARIVTMKSFEDILDIPLDNPGDYTLVLQDSAGNTIAQTGFSPSFRSSRILIRP